MVEKIILAKKEVLFPTRVNSLGVPILQIACTPTCSIAVTTRGEVFMWGVFGSTGKHFKSGFPRKLVTLKDIWVTQVTCTATSIAFVTDIGDVYLWEAHEDNALVVEEKEMQQLFSKSLKRTKSERKNDTRNKKNVTITNLILQ
jgi:alpha-tubulin suppressor-like RCC1 family protein